MINDALLEKEAANMPFSGQIWLYIASLTHFAPPRPEEPIPLMSTCDEKLSRKPEKQENEEAKGRKIA